MKKNALFVHSFFRSGSTYIFHAFRRSSDDNYCYQEPLNEFVINALEAPEALLELKGSGDMQRQLKHPDIGRPYFAELFDTFEYWKSTIRPEISYDDYFGLHAPKETNAYLAALVKAPKQNNIVIQECRTGARIGNIKDYLGGFHVSLWRNPWDQWWSCKSTEYFENISQVIASARKIPPIIQKICDVSGIAILPGHTFAQQMRHFEQRWVKPDSSYMLFFALWCLNMLEGQTQADMVLSIDRLSNDTSYQNEVVKRLSEAGFAKLEFSDCDITQSVFTLKDSEFFRPIEEKVYAYLLETGTPHSQVQALRDACNNSTHIFEDIKSLSALEQKHMETIRSLRSVVLKSQEGREREGAHSNTHISILNTQIIDLKKKQLESEDVNAQIKRLNERFEQTNVETHDQIIRYQILLQEQAGNVKRLTHVAEGLCEQKDALFSKLILAQSQLENERKHYAVLQSEHEGLLDFIQTYEQDTQAVIQTHLHAREELTKSLNAAMSQTQDMKAAKQTREAELITQIDQHEAALQNVLTSTSWRIMQPARSVFNLRLSVRAFVKTQMFKLLTFIRSRPVLKVLVMGVVGLVPSLKSKAVSFSANNPRSLIAEKSTSWNLQLDKGETKMWISALKKEDKV